MQVIDDFLTPSYHSEILQFVEGGEMQWYYSPDITVDGKVSKQLGLHGFSNHFYDIMRETPPSPFQSLMMPFLFQVKDLVKSPRILRARLDMTLYNPFCLPDACAHTPHVDMNGEHHTAVYYVNDSDGDTIIYNEREELGTYTIKQKVTPKQGRMVLFDGSLYHTAEQPLNNVRCVVNYNLG
jgi:hypothetical protein